MSKVIEFHQLTKLYDGNAAVNELTLSINKGEIFGLLGPNGAGKTTTILMLLGLIEPTDGSIQVKDIDPVRRPIEVKKRVGYLPDNLGFYQHMTGLENLLYIAQLNGLPEKKAKERAEHLLEKVGLSEAANKKTGKYSRGMKQRLGLAEVLMKQPEIIVLDEPTLGIDPEGVREVLAFIRELNEEEGMTILLSSHHLHQVQEICDRVGIFVDGELLAKGAVSELAEQLFFEDAYVIHIKGSPLTTETIQQISDLAKVSQVERVNEEEVNVYCQENMTAQIADILVKQNVQIEQLRKKDYGLDEIYHRYFEGRDEQ
ncbi:MAG TPA: ABC transporter ATP-binding protein [Bacillota bacterium]|nr:ABC transporter ATP-binding protein [Bacillota bacterium]